MLALLSDLRQYTSFQNIKLEPHTYGWYVKQLCEHCKKKDLVDELMRAIKYAYDNNYQNDDFYLFDRLVGDYHLSDAFDGLENIMLEIIVHCFVEDVIIEVDDAPLEYQFMEYTNTGRRINGLKPNVLSEFLEDWKCFSEIENEDTGKKMSDKEIVEAQNNGDLPYMYEETYMTSCIIIVDENEQNIIDFNEFLSMIAFQKVTHGMYYFGLISYDGSIESPSDLGKREIEEICKTLNSYEIYQKLDDDLFIMLNDDGVNSAAYKLLDKLKICSSRKEVIF